MIGVFDLGNVLVFHFQARFFARVSAACRPEAPVVDLLREALRREQVGRGGDFEKIYPVLRDQADLRLSREEFLEAWNDIFEPNPPMVDYVRRLPHPRVLLSNTNEPHVTWIQAHFPDVFPLFDLHVLSNEVGLEKPEAAIYHYVEEKTGAAPESLIFVDDVETNVEAAPRRGGRAWCLQGWRTAACGCAAWGLAESG